MKRPATTHACSEPTTPTPSGDEDKGLRLALQSPPPTAEAWDQRRKDTSMTIDPKLKKAIRDRMKQTGEPYVLARRNVLNEQQHVESRSSLPVSSSLSPGPGSLWNRIPLGTNINGNEVAWDVKLHPHLLFSAQTGSGYSMTEKVILSHVLAPQHNWEMIA